MADTIVKSVTTIHPLHEHCRRELIVAHAILRRSIGRLIEFAPKVGDKDQKHFLVFCNTFIDFAHQHHEIQDKICFPLLTGPCGIQADLEKLGTEHETMTKLVNDLKATLDLPAYDGHKIAESATALKETMNAHLAVEQSILLTEVIARADPSVITEMRAKIDALVKTGNPFTMMPFIASNLTKDDTDFLIFAEAPWLLKNVLYPLLFARRYKQAWVYSSHPQDNALAA